jgi:uncharacterized hydantoinase/oxoprolinase family protein
MSVQGGTVKASVREAKGAAMTPIVQVMHADALRDRRAALLAETGLTESDLRRRAEVYSLTAELSAVLDEIEEIDYLLGSD